MRWILTRVRPSNSFDASSRIDDLFRLDIGSLRPLLTVPRSRSQMFLAFVSSPRYQDADMRLAKGVYVENEFRCGSYQY